MTACCMQTILCLGLAHHCQLASVQGPAQTRKLRGFLLTKLTIQIGNIHKNIAIPADPETCTKTRKMCTTTVHKGQKSLHHSPGPVLQPCTAGHKDSKPPGSRRIGTAITSTKQNTRLLSASNSSENA